MDIKKRFDRILQLFFFLQSRTVVSSEELTECFGVSQRTIYRDLKALEAAGVPIVNEPGSGYAIMDGYRLQPSRFTQEETLSLMVADKMMQQHETQFIKRHFESALIKIKSSFQVHQKNDLLDLEDKVHFNRHSSAQEYLPNIIDVLLNSTLKRKIVTLQYIKGSETSPTQRRVEPVGIFYENDFWYVMAYCHLRNDYRNFRLDRIKRVSLSDDSFTREHPTVSELRCKERPEQFINITVRVEKPLAHYLYWDRQNMGFKSEETAGDNVIMHFACPMHPMSFVRWFLHFVDFGEILDPPQLQADLMEIVNMAQHKAKERSLV